jgi:hypothetical protein
MSWRIILTGFSKRVESVAVSSFHKESEMRPADRRGGVRAYDGSGAGGNEFMGWMTCKGLT